MRFDGESIRYHRQSLLSRLGDDGSYDVFAMMAEMTRITSDYLADRLCGTSALVWVGGSLGRCEMLPGSDVDAFLITESLRIPGGPQPNVKGFRKFELGYLTKSAAVQLLETSLVDANRLIDGRSLGGESAGDIEQAILTVATPDRQLANIVTEYFYWFYFDFPHKTGSGGANYKYSSGASRTTMLFNLVYRQGTGRFPFQGQSSPELAHALDYLQRGLGVRVPYQAINLTLLAKDVAASHFSAGDPRGIRATAASLAAVYELCSKRLRERQIHSSGDFSRCYYSARRELERSVNMVVKRALDMGIGERHYEAMLARSNEDLLDLCGEGANRTIKKWSRTETALASWLLSVRNVSRPMLQLAVQELTRQPIGHVWGALMAVICARNVDDELLKLILSWLDVNEKGAYLAKVIGRSPAAGQATRAAAQALCIAREGILQLDT